jgi:hypothetical protein
MLHLAPLAPTCYAASASLSLKLRPILGGTGVQSPPELGDLGGFLVHCVYTTFSPPSPPSLGGTGVQSPPVLGEPEFKVPQYWGMQGGGFHRLV